MNRIPRCWRSPSPCRGGGVRLFLLPRGSSMDPPSDTAIWNQVAGMLSLEHRLENSLQWQEETRKHSPEISSQLGSIRGNALRHIRRLEGLTGWPGPRDVRSEEHTSELQSQSNLVCRLLLEKKKKKKKKKT